MSDKFNLIEGTLTEEQVNEILKKLDEIRAFMPFAVAMKVEDRNLVTKPGADGLNASAAMADALVAHRKSFPEEGMPDPVAIKQDIALAAAFDRIIPPLESLLQAVLDSALTAKSDAFRNALKVYTHAKPAIASVPGLSERVRPMTDHLNRPARRKKEN